MIRAELTLVPDPLADLGGANSDAHRPIGGTVCAWGAAVPVYRHFLGEPDGPGWRLNRSAFESDLIAAARAAGVITLAVGLKH